MLGTFLDKFGGFFDRRFVVAYVIPILCMLALTVVVFQVQYGTKATLAWWVQLEVQEQILLAGGTLLSIILAAYIFEMLTAPIVRLYEGYWPDWWLTRRAITLQQKKKNKLARTAKIRELNEKYVELVASYNASLDEKQKASIEEKVTEIEEQIRIEDKQAYAASYYSFPSDYKLVKPTLLGNVLAAAEEYSHQVYRLDAVTWWPRLVSTLSDTFRIQIDTALTPMLTVLNLSMILTLWALIGSFVLLINQHWLACVIIFLVGLLLAKGCYSAAINQAVVYGRLVRVAFDLYRQEIFKQMHIIVPDNLVGERLLWEVLTNWHYYYIVPWESPDKIPELDYPFYYDMHYTSIGPSNIVVDHNIKSNNQFVQIRSRSKAE